MWPEQRQGFRQRWRGFRDPLGDRIIVEAASGLRSEGLVLAHPLVQEDAAVAVLAHTVEELADLSHPALRVPRALSRLREGDGGAVVVSDYLAGVRLSALMADPARDALATGTVLHIARQAAAALRALAGEDRGWFHGAVGPDRLLLAPDGRLLLVELGLGPFLAAQTPRGPDDWWSAFGLGVPLSPHVAPFAPATDSYQLGLLVLELLLGRRIRRDEYPHGLALLLGTAQETDLVGSRAPLSTTLFEWLSLALGLESDGVPPAIPVVADALEELLSDEGGFVAVSVGLDAEPESLEPWPFAQDERALASLPPPGALVVGSATTSVVNRVPTEAIDSPATPLPAAPDRWGDADDQPPDAWRHLATTPVGSESPASDLAISGVLAHALPNLAANPGAPAPDLRVVGDDSIESLLDRWGKVAREVEPATRGPVPSAPPSPSRQARRTPPQPPASAVTAVPRGPVASGRRHGERGRRPAHSAPQNDGDEWLFDIAETIDAARTTRPGRPPIAARMPDPAPTARTRWPASVRWGMAALALTLAAWGGLAGWRYWRDRSIGQETGTAVIDSKPPGATILIDGIERGKAPLSLALAPGRHDVVAKTAAGMGQARLDLSVGERHEMVVPLELGTDPGSIEISTEPAGARITLDGTSRGRSPLSLDEVSPGEHQLVVEQGAARLERRFTLAPSERLTVYVPLAGWVTVRAQVPLEVFDRGRALGVTTAGRLLVPAGRRRLQLVNQEFGVNTTHDIVVRAGQAVHVDLPLPAGVLSISTDLPADVSVDGTAVGRTPTGNLSVPIGEHEVVVSHPRWGEQRLTVVVGLGSPTRLALKLAGATGARGRAQRTSPKRS